MKNGKTSKKRRVRRLLCVAVICGIVVAVMLLAAGGKIGKWRVDVEPNGSGNLVLEVDSEYREEGANASYGSRWIKWFKRIPLEVTTEGEVNTGVIGTYKVTYTAQYKSKTGKAYRYVTVADTKPPVITLLEDERRYTPYGKPYVEEGYTATDEHEGDLTDRVKVEVRDDGYAYYTVEDSSGNKANVSRKIRYDDRTEPTVTLKGDRLTYVDIRKEYEEPGYTASDDCDGDLTASVQVTSMPGAWDNETIYSYRVTDSHGNLGEATRIVVTKDLETPEIKLTGGNHVKVYVGDRFREPGFQAVDYAEGDLSDKVTVEGEIDNFTPGVYPYTYRVTDSEGYEGTVVREVEVVKREQPETVRPEGKIIYLTFDDGPCAYTEELLDILKKYDVKVTFFVTNQFPNSIDIIRREAEEGHTVAVHTYSHEYGLIYKSKEAYLEDLNQMNDIIEEKTGKRATILRFPGGSSNAVSRHYCVGIMRTLTEFFDDVGFQYFDWNVPSGDTDGATTSQEVADMVIRYVQNNNISIVLQHDIKLFSVRAVERIIQWGLENGYTFLPLQPDSPTVHHRLNN